MWKTLLGLVLVAGCAHEAKTSSGLDTAYEDVMSGARSSARGGGYLVEKANDSSVRVVREEPVGGLGGDVSDAWITTKLKGKLGIDKGMSSRNVHVSTDAGVVSLRGTVESKEEALSVIRDALSLDGVAAVDSQLEWPMRANR